MSNFEDFLTGFMTQTTATRERKKEKAENFFERQMEKAMAISAGPLKERRQRLSEMNRMSTELMTQANMPEEIVRAIASDGPEALEKAYEIYDATAKSGAEVDEFFWRETYKLTEDFKPSDEPLDKFFGRVLGLYPDNVKAEVERGTKDPLNAFTAALFGDNAMDRAMRELQTTEVSDGFTAAELLSMENEPAYGGGAATVDREAYYDTIREKDEDKEISDSAFRSFKTRFETIYQRKLEEAAAGDFAKFKDPAVQEEARRAAAQEIATEVTNPDLYIERWPEFGEWLSPGVTEEAPSTGELTPQGEEVTPEPSKGIPPSLSHPEFGDSKYIEEREEYYVYEGSGGQRFLVPKEEFANTPSQEESTQDQGMTGDPVAARLQQGLTEVMSGESSDNFYISEGEAPPAQVDVGEEVFTFTGESMEDMQGNKFLVYESEEGVRMPIPLKGM